MKWRNSYAVVAGCAVVGMTSFNAQAQSAFAGFYGQLSTGYESNQLGSQTDNVTVTPNTGTETTNAAASQTFGGAPLIIGAGYYWQANEKWLLGVGADYSVLKTSSNYSASGPKIAAGQSLTFNGLGMQLSNRFNLFLTPAYAIDKDKLVYLKAGYSQVTAQYNRANSVTITSNGGSSTASSVGGNQSSNQGGYLIGLGYKQIITSGLYGFVEGNYMGYSSPSYTYSSSTATDNAIHGAGASTRTVTTSFSSLNTYQLLVGLGYAF